MILKLRVDASGNIISQYRTAESWPEHGTTEDGFLCLDSIRVLDMHLDYWDGEAWATRAPAPNNFCVWENGEWVESEDKKLVVQSWIMARGRAERDVRLSMSDWTQFPDSPLTDEKKAEWVAYRQALRDVPANNSEVTDLNDIIWPTSPI